MNEETLWEIPGEILNLGEFIAAVPNIGASAIIIEKFSIGIEKKF